MLRISRKTWEYHTGDFSDGSDGRPKTTFQATPILVDGVLYLATVYGRVIALNPETGAEIWTYDPGVTRRSIEVNSPTVG